VCGVIMVAFRLPFVIGSSCILNLDISKSKVIISTHYSFAESNPLIKSSFNSLIFTFISTHRIVKYMADIFSPVLHDFCFPLLQLDT
jgi:hypothetical protein